MYSIDYIHVNVHQIAHSPSLLENCPVETSFCEAFGEPWIELGTFEAGN